MTDEIETPRKHEKRVFQIPNFLTLRKYGDTYHQKEHEELKRRMENEKNPLLSGSQDQGVQMSKKAKSLLVSFIVGFLIAVAFSATMGVQVPTCKIGGQVDGIMKWMETNCTIYYNVIFSLQSTMATLSFITYVKFTTIFSSQS